MNKDLHPEYFPNAAVTCACGTKFTVGSTSETLSVELCSQCHPFYTGKQKLVDTARRVERFKEREEKKTSAAATRRGRKVKKKKLATLKKEKTAKAEKEQEGQ